MGPAELFVQGLGRSCRCGTSHVARPLISQSAALGLGHCWAGWSTDLGLSHVAGPSAALGLSPKAGHSAALGLCIGLLASAPSDHPPEVSGVGPQSANLGARNWASGECRGCLSCFHSPGAYVGRVPEAAAAAECSLTSHQVPLFSLFLFEKFFLFKPPWSKQAPGPSHSPAWLSPKNPAADPAPGPRLHSPWSPCRSQGPCCPQALFLLSDLSMSSIFGL